MKPFTGIFQKILNKYYQLIKKVRYYSMYLIRQRRPYCILVHIYGATQPLFVFQVSNFLPPFESKDLNNSKFTLDGEICWICIS